MVVKDILKYAILFCGKPQLLGLNTFSESSETLPTVQEQADIDLFLQCFNFVYKEIASVYFPLLEKEDVVFIENKFYLKDLPKIPVNIKKVYIGKKNIKFFVYPDHIFAETDKAVVVYSILPEDFAIDQEVNLFSGRVLPQVMAYGVAREFCLINGDYSSADIWESRFKDSLKVGKSANRFVTLPKRRFL